MPMISIIPKTLSPPLGPKTPPAMVAAHNGLTQSPLTSQLLPLKGSTPL